LKIWKKWKWEASLQASSFDHHSGTAAQTASALIKVSAIIISRDLSCMASLMSNLKCQAIAAAIFNGTSLPLVDDSSSKTIDHEINKYSLDDRQVIPVTMVDI
jgi:hypothetical protein